VGFGGLLVANELAKTGGKKPIDLLNQREQGRDWDRLAAENRYDLTTALSKLERVQQAMEAQQKQPTTRRRDVSPKRPVLPNNVGACPWAVQSRDVSAKRPYLHKVRQKVQHPSQNENRCRAHVLSCVAGFFRFSVCWMHFRTANKPTATLGCFSGTAEK